MIIVLTPVPVADTIYTMKKSIVMMAVLLAAIIGSILLIGCPDETGTGGGANPPAGENWTAQISNVSRQLWDIHYANGLWVAAGNGSITTSTNGTTWTAQTTGGARAVHYANGLWVAVSGGIITTSTNGTTWTAQTISGVYGLQAVHYATDENGNGLWVAGGGTSGPDDILTSTDGTMWTARTHPASTIQDIHYATDENGNGLWVAVDTEGDVITSTNSTTWTAQDSKITSGQLWDIHYANGLWVAVGGEFKNSTTIGAITTSTSGTAWTAQTSNVSGDLYDVHYANGLWVAVGSNTTTDSMGMTTITGAITTSTNGTTWTAQTSNVSGGLADIHYANGLWVAVGSNTTTDSMGNQTRTGIITTSTSGTAWTAQDSKITSGDLYDVHYANGLLVAVGWNTTIDDRGFATDGTGAIITAP